MADIKSVCVFCGSAAGDKPEYREAAQAMGTLLAREGIKLVYGGGKIGLMGAVADAALKAGGKVHGVIPKALAIKEIAATDLTDIEVVDTMHERKARMAELSDAFVTLPGGIGTLEELFEVFTWGQLGWHSKPIGLLEVGGYYDKLLDFLLHATEAGFMKRRDLGMLQTDVTPEAVLGKLRAYVPPPVPVYVGRKDL